MDSMSKSSIEHLPVPDHVPPELVQFCDFRTDLGACPHTKLAEFHNGPRVFYSPVSHQDRGKETKGAWVVTKAEDIRYVLQQTELFSSAQPRSHVMGDTWKLIPLELDPPEHTKFRMVLNPLFSPKKVRTYEEKIRSWAIELIEDFVNKGRSDFVADFCEPYPVGIFLDLLGLPRSELARFRKWVNSIVHDREGRAVAMGEVKDFLVDVISDRKSNPGEDDLLTLVTQLEVDERALTDDEMLGIAFILFIGGLDTVIGSLSFHLHYLADNPQDQARLRADSSLLPDAVEELFRAFSIVTTARTATQDTELAGVQIKKGDLVTASTVMSTRDPDEFSNPNELDLTRNPNRHNAFSFGPHRCLGSHLARLEVNIALEELLKRLPAFELEANANIEALGGGVLGLEALPVKW